MPDGAIAVIDEAAGQAVSLALALLRLRVSRSSPTGLVERLLLGLGVVVLLSALDDKLFAALTGIQLDIRALIVNLSGFDLGVGNAERTRDGVVSDSHGVAVLRDGHVAAGIGHPPRLGKRLHGQR